MNRKSFLACHLVASFVFLAVTAGPCEAAKEEKAAKDEMYKQVELFADAISIIEKDYVEEVKPKDAIYGALKGLLASLDAHSQFLTPEDYNEMRVETKGEFGGLGIEITIKDDLLTIIAPIDDTPAFKAGLKAGDRIVRIDGVSTKNITLTDAVKKLRGKPGTSVNLTILRDVEKKVFDVAITRDTIKIKSIKEASILADKIGYIRLSEFQENSPTDLEKALMELEAKGLDGLVLDVRNNPGGLLDVASYVAEKFLREGLMIVYTKGRISDQNLEFRSRVAARSRGHMKHLGYPMVVLINGGSASGSEILAGALQDHKRAVLLGTKSFGKGSVQTIIPLRDGSALRLTTSKYYTPSGRTIHGVGITPDLIVEEVHKPKEKPEKEEEKVSQDAKDVFEKIEKEEKPEDVAFKKRLEEDIQLARAFDLLKGITIYESKAK